jgi:hypothetical protein
MNKQLNTILLTCLALTANPVLAASALTEESLVTNSDDDWEDTDDWEDDDSFSSTQISGFLEARSGIRLQNDRYQKKASINELRLKTELGHSFENFDIKFNADFVADSVIGNQALNLQSGQGFMDLRELYVNFSPSDNIDLKIGRQVLTWGTGDLVFINDLFSKDWRSFFNGRDTQYLKAPSDAIKASLYFDTLNFDLVYSPQYNSDRFINAERLSYLNSTNQPVKADVPDNDDELSVRAYRSFGAAEAALYYYQGHTKSPAGFNQKTDQMIFPKLKVYGASIRKPLAKGIFNAELGLRHLATPSNASISYSKEDEWRALVGYEQEIAKELTAAVQYYVEVKKGQSDRHLTTLRLQKQMMQQKLKLSFFNFYSPNQRDGYLRINTSYKYSDDLKFEIGSNAFYGKNNQGFFSQFKDNNNLYAAIKLSF